MGYVRSCQHNMTCLLNELSTRLINMLCWGWKIMTRLIKCFTPPKKQRNTKFSLFKQVRAAPSTMSTPNISKMTKLPLKCPKYP